MRTPGIRRLAAGFAVALSLALAATACRPSGGNDNLLQDLRGSWSAAESVELYGRSLLTSTTLTFGPTGASMVADTTESGALLHRLTAAGTYSVTETPATLTLSFGSARQSAAMDGGAFDAENLVDLTVDDLADLAADFPAGLTLSIAGTSLTLSFPDHPDLVFDRSP